MLKRFVVMLWASGMLVSCLSDAVTSTTSEQLDTTPMSQAHDTTSIAPSTTTTIVNAENRQRWIEVSGDEFVGTRTGERFTPVGVNLLLAGPATGCRLLLCDFLGRLMPAAWSSPREARKERKDATKPYPCACGAENALVVDRAR